MKADKTIQKRSYKGCEQGNEISFSVLMPTFNQCAFIRRAISSLLQQTYPYWELIIINDGCTDATKDFIADYLSDPRIKYLENDTNRGPYSDLSALQQEFAQCWDVNTHRYEIDDVELLRYLRTQYQGRQVAVSNIRDALTQHRAVFLRIVTRTESSDIGISKRYGNDYVILYYNALMRTYGYIDSVTGKVAELNAVNVDSANTEKIIFACERRTT